VFLRVDERLRAGHKAIEMEASDFVSVVGWWVGSYALGWAAGMLHYTFRRLFEQF